MKNTLKNLTTPDYFDKMIDLGFMPYRHHDDWPDYVRQSVSECIDNTPEGSAGDHSINRLRVTPCAPGYLPLFVPSNLQWLENAQHLFAVSTQAVIAEIYVKALELKRDHKEKPLYLFWNHDVPLPTPLTSLFWLLTCEAWPMPNHRLFANDEVDVRRVDKSDGELTQAFPFQSIHMPQGSPLGSAGTQPTGFNLGRHVHMETKPLNASFAMCLTREDRAMMDDVRQNPLIARPRKVQFTHLDAHRGLGPRLQWWSDTFPWAPVTSIDSGYAASEWQESFAHHQRLYELRKLVMDSFLTAPGIPGSDAYANSFFDAPGLWIRNWSEQGIIVRGSHNMVNKWTTKGESIALASGQPLNQVPSVSPRVWFGFTAGEIGEKYKEVDGMPKRLQSATERWVEHYTSVREVGLRMLFGMLDGDSLESLLEGHLVKLEDRLKKAGRIRAPNQKEMMQAQMSKLKFDL